jgi:hypothetical protein
MIGSFIIQIKTIGSFLTESKNDWLMSDWHAAARQKRD